MLRVSRSGLAAALAALLAPAVAAQITFQDVTAGSGLVGIPFDDSDYSEGTHGIGMCALDFDADGDLDVFFGGSYRLNPTPHRLFRNDGGMQFTDVTNRAGFGPNLGVVAAQSADIDNDGDEDLLLGNWRQPLQLYLNDGTGAFVEATAAWGLTQYVASTYGVSFGDYDRDGLLDLYVGNRFSAASPHDPVTEPSHFYRNLGDRYVEVFRREPVVAADAATFFAVFMDFNDDGWPDIYTVNDKGPEYDGNRLFLNREGVLFEDVSVATGAYDEMYGMGIDFVDAFNDGGLDFYVTDLWPDHLFRIWDEDTGTYVNGTHTYGMPGGATGWAAHFRDFDNDGWTDLHVVHMGDTNHLYRNPAHPAADLHPWPLVSNPISPHYLQLCALAADFDNDGRVDLMHRFLTHPALPAPDSVQLHRNVTPTRHWISIDTKGTKSNRNGFGAKIELRTGDTWQTKWRRHGVGFIGGNDHRVHFGLGDSAIADEIRITWPSGITQHLRSVPGDRVFTVVEPSMRIVGDPTMGSACIIELHSPADAGSNYAIMLAASDAPKTTLPDGRVLPLRVDPLTALSLTPGNAILHGNVAALHRGVGGGLLTLPNQPGLRGLTLYATGITFDAQGLGAVLTEPVEILIE